MSIFSKMGAEAAEATNDNSNGKKQPDSALQKWV